ncbi:helix-turn-helix domain-containing protein [Paracoccus yeei]|uniref:helix-turn-helix domain-containing protein n=1 Tax=Paracoccus yeei TaxID=147645 RepID=UPI00174D4F9D|nr:helix-turn-helix domain-containing protein [Paracoccus yeei]
MSVEAMAWVWKNGPADPTERLVLLAIADHADDHGWCYPSMAGIAAKACVTERGARGIVRRLEAGGWVTVKVGGGRGGKSKYCVLMGRNPERETGNVIPGKINPERETGNVATQNPERGDTKPGTSVPPNHQGTIKEPSTTARETAPVVVAISDQTKRRDEVLRLMGLDGVIRPDGKFTGMTNDQAELPKWDDLGLTRAEQDAKISEMLAKQRAKDPAFLPNRWAWFTAGMTDLAAAKRRGPAANSPELDRDHRRAMRRKIMGA